MEPTMLSRLYTPLRRAYLLLMIDSIQQSIAFLDAEMDNLPEQRQVYLADHTRRRRQLQALEAQTYRLPRPIPTVSWPTWRAATSAAWSRAQAWCCARWPAVRG
jgi:hypothetical protein